VSSAAHIVHENPGCADNDCNGCRDFLEGIEPVQVHSRDLSYVHVSWTTDTAGSENGLSNRWQARRASSGRTRSEPELGIGKMPTRRDPDGSGHQLLALGGRLFPTLRIERRVGPLGALCRGGCIAFVAVFFSSTGLSLVGQSAGLTQRGRTSSGRCDETR
jgi:hypothetical protein